MSLPLDNEQILLTSLSRCETIFRKSARKTQKKEKSLSPDCFCHPSPKQKGEAACWVTLLAPNKACAPA
jgi:hypothetical protein